MATITYSLTGTCTGEDGTVYHIGESSSNRVRVEALFAYYMGIDFVAYQLILSAACGDKIQRKEFVKSL